MNEHLDNLEPKAVFEQFKPILSIPRPSKKRRQNECLSETMGRESQFGNNSR